MLIEFKVTNYLSIREQTTLSLVKAKSEELKSTNTFVPGAPATPELLRSSALYGANAAGKSNFIKALQFMKGLVMRSASESQAGEKLSVTTFLLDETSKKKPNEFEVTFVSQGVRYQYGFAVTQERIIEEWLLAYPKGRPQRWIERAYDEKSQAYVWGKMEKLSGQKQLWQAATRSNALFLSTAIQLNNQQLTPVFKWFSSTLHVAGIGAWSPSFSIKLCENLETKNTIIRFLKAADVDIDDIQLKKEKFNKENLPDDMPDELKKQIEEKFGDQSIVNVKTAHSLTSGKKVLFDMDNESDGTQKIFALAGPWIDTLENGYVLVIDELHDHLHPLMVKFLINLFHCRETNPKNAQLIFTTHDTSILNQEVFRRDQIWFCEKDKDQSSKLYPLTDFSPRKGVENLERGYLIGRYGALPYLKNVKMAMGC
ncbi:MAG TPA: ATP-binding protein [Nitrospirae bacterium]|nr:hypothetical protein BMS3Abin06_02163 [bacterium BMS3Abin06]HDH10806.1 ATP-binding protein [Nitrospirota bacterium]HDZ00950.1 ATP-binding protein [Nitrospirota bacterium]